MLVKTKNCALSQILEKSWNMITLVIQQSHLSKKVMCNWQKTLFSLEKILVISFGDTTDIQNESKSDTKKTSSEERDSYKDDDDGKDSDYEPPLLLEYLSAVGKNFWGILPVLNGSDKGRKPRLVENVVGDVRRIFKIVTVDNVTALFQNDMNVLRKKYSNSICVEKATEPGSIKKYIISITDFVNFLIVMKVPIGIENDELIRWNWKGTIKKGLLERKQIWKC